MTAAPARSGETSHRYEALAGFVAGLIESGALKPGMRAPSLRRIAARRRVSLSTAIQAYRLLEDRGVLEARPKSGFFVAARAAEALETPRISAPPRDASTVAVASEVIGLLEHAADAALAPLGCAVPSAELLSASGLDRHLARAARVKGVAYNTYAETRGDARLRAELGARALRCGLALAPDDIALTCGCTEALTLALRAVARPGDAIAVESPGYFGLLQALEAQGLKALELPTDATTGVDLAALEAALASGQVKACLLSSSFQNPLGFALSETRKREILALLARHETPLIEDDIYGDLHFGEERPRPFAALAAEAGLAVEILLCSSFSKTLAPGYRVGWIAAPGPARGRMRRILEAKYASTLCGPTLPQAALADFLAAGGYDRHLRRIRRAFAENVERMSAGVARRFPPATRLSRPAGGFVLWLELPERFDSRAFYERALTLGISVAPGDVFSASGRYRNCLRLSCGHAWDARIEASVATLGALAGEMLARDAA